MSTTYIKIPNNIIGKSKGHSCIIYLYLLYLCTVNQSNSVKVKQETIANKMRISFAESVNRTMKKLQKEGYINIKNNFNPKTGWLTCNTITVCNFNPQNDYFLLPAEYIFVDMPAIAMELLLTLYVYSFNDPLCFPSFSQISETAKMSSNSIVKAYTILEEKGIIKKENYIKQDGSKGHNCYFLIKKIEKIVGEGKTEKFIAWIEKQKKIYFLLWQLIKEVLMGNVAILDEICTQIETVKSCNHSTDTAEFLPVSQIKEHKKPTLFEFLKEKVNKFKNKVRDIFVTASHNVIKALFRC